MRAIRYPAFLLLLSLLSVDAGAQTTKLVPMQPMRPATPATPAISANTPPDHSAPVTSAESEITEEVFELTELEPLLDVIPVDIDALATRTCARFGHLGPLLATLETLSLDEAQPEARRRAARWTRAMLLRQRGDFSEALRALEPFVEEEGNTEARLRRAELLDATGKTREAIEVYETVLEELQDEEIETHVRLRLALLQMEVGSDLKDALARFAREEGRDSSMRNRAAVVLGLIERPADAIELFQVDESDPKRFRQEVRVAEWAIRAGDGPKAQEFAWKAANSAKLKRDRFYGLTILVEAHRLDDSLDSLIDKLAALEEPGDDFRRVWIELLRERERYDEAIALFAGDAPGAGDSFSIEERRQLLEMYREKGDEDVMIGVYRQLIDSEPTEVEWREGLSRAYLERGDRKSADELWREFIEHPQSESRRLEGADVMMALGLDELAIQAAELCIAEDRHRFAALIFLFNLHKNRGRLGDAEAALERMESMAADEAAERYQLADAWEQLGRQDRAVEVLEAVRAARGEDASGEDLEMRLAWLYSEIGEEEIALERWREIWLRIKSISRRRYAEDRMMTVASRLGSLADIAIDLEQKLVAGTASERDSGLLVRLYTKVGDPVSAAEVIDEFMKRSGGSVIDTLQEKGRVYLACNDYYNYEKVVRQLIEVDAAGEGDYLRQLAMSQLERGKPNEAREVLARLKALEVGTESEEFEAGVLALAGMREEAIRSYRRGIAVNPGRIESYLLMANLMKEMGEVERAVGMFQHLAETAEKDDLFTIAIDGLLNVEAPAHVMQWARRITLERLARRHDKMYLYQLLADLAEQVEDREGMLTALEGSLSISGERRPSVLRELMDLAKGSGTSFTGRGWEGDEDKHLAYGRRLIGLSEVVPPQVYLDLGDAFLRSRDPLSATKTFRLANDLPDYTTFQRQAAGLFEQSGFRDEALELYKQVLIAQSGDVGLMVKVGELEEQNGRDEAAYRLYREALEILFTRQPISTLKATEEKKRGSFFAWYGSRNIDDYDKYYDRLLKNLLVVLPEGDQATALLDSQLAQTSAEIAQMLESRIESGAEEAQRSTLDKHPRVRARAAFTRRLAIAFESPERADELDLVLLAALPGDEDLLENLCQERIRWGLYGSVRKLLDEAPRDEREIARLRFLVGDGLEERSARRLPIDQATGLFLPLLMEGKTTEAGVVLRRTDFTGVSRDDLSKIEPLFSASLYLGDPSLTLQISREWIKLHVKNGSGSYLVQPVIQKCKAALNAEDYRNLCLSFTDQVLANPEETSDFLTLLPDLQEDFEEPLITEEQVMELLDEFSDGGWGYGLGPVMLLLPEEQRGAAMRTVWSKVKPTMQMLFVMNLIGDAKQELGPAVSQFLAGNFADAIKTTDDMYMGSLAYYISQVIDSGHNQELGLKLFEAFIEAKPEDWAAYSGRAQLLLVMGRTEEAQAEARRVYIETFDKKSDEMSLRMVKQELMEKFLPDHADLFLGALDELEQERESSVELVQARIDLLRRAEREDEIAGILVSAIEQFPEEVKFLDLLREHYRKEGRRTEALELLMRIIEIDPQRKESLFQYWLGLQNPIQALAIKEELRAEGAGEEEKPGKGDPAGGVAMGMIMLSPMGSSPFGMEEEEGDDKPTIAKVKEATEDQDWDEARTTFRRLWRQFPKGEETDRGSMIFFIGGNRGSSGMRWPADKMEGPEEKPKPRRGGLDDWVEDPPRPEPGRSAYDALAEYEFGVDEMQRLLRSKTARELDSQREVFKGLLRARVLESGEEGALAELSAAVRDGRAGKLETTMLLTLLDERPELQSEATAELLTDLARSVRPVDIGPLRALARVQARQGNSTEARCLYKWLATRSQSSNFFSFDETPTISQYELVKDVKENLEGEDRLAVIDAVIAFADPGENPWAREGFEQLVLETYMELLDPEDAVERSRHILENATDFKDGMRRIVARLASVLWAQAGEHERALECLEYGICSLDPDVVEAASRRWTNPENPAWYGDDDIRRLAPKDGARFSDYSAWLSALCDSLQAWRQADRVRPATTHRLLILACLRLHAEGGSEKALEVLSALAADESLDARYELWVIDALRKCGGTELANSMERAAFDEDRLYLERVHEVVERELEAKGPEAALALGAPKTEYTLNERLLETLIRAAEQLGDEAILAKWTALLEETLAAKKELDELAEE